MCEPSSGPSKTSPDLVHDDEGSVLRAQLTELLQKAGFGNDDAASPEDRLDHHGGDVSRRQCFF